MIENVGREVWLATVVVAREAVAAVQTDVDRDGSGQGLRPETVATAPSDLAGDDAVLSIDTGRATSGARATCT